MDHYEKGKISFSSLYSPVLDKISEISDRSGNILIAVDGPTCSGKTFFAAAVKERFGASVFHTDDFYLPSDERNSNWKEIPAGNMDIGRVKKEIIIPVSSGEDVTFRRYDCRCGKYSVPVRIRHTGISLIEGSYSLHPELAGYYDLKIFLTCSKKTQHDRLMERDCDKIDPFEKLWIPMEERYFEKYKIKKNADMVLKTDIGQENL